jgi:FG-GAP repeat protein
VRVARLTSPHLRSRTSFGSSVSLAQNGKTALIGDPDDTKHAGAAWVFAASG